MKGEKHEKITCSSTYFLSVTFFSIKIDYNMIIPYDTPTSTVNELYKFILEKNPEISLTDYGINKESYKYLYQNYHEKFKNHILTILDLFLFNEINGEYMLPYNLFKNLK
ncbi:hypothetical protein [Thermosipho melanesiensis]|uniref:Uncharacterized protein n=1 Tax=Thermosipho melanesiensis (strain DSM 12029 / CIP 104789 / BI429) TaxID=391009 RepID=A6LNQ7_THEM4|nr:hypothetical protein [Thermosipho melanesiensis]ABR31558.1 hypothetical protein Tmel_1719 [Thermosipho melanesiensis BI429]